VSCCNRDLWWACGSTSVICKVSLRYEEGLPIVNVVPKPTPGPAQQVYQVNFLLPPLALPEGKPQGKCKGLPPKNWEENPPHTDKIQRRVRTARAKTPPTSSVTVAPAAQTMSTAKDVAKGAKLSASHANYKTPPTPDCHAPARTGHL
jgi:hypothetical protein